MTAREYLFALETFGIKLGLDQVRRLLLALDCPDLAFPSILVAGTNGKGSVTAMIEHGLRDSGYRTGRYTSPHLVHIEERIAIDGVPIAPETFDRLAARIRNAASVLPHAPSFFEATTVLALEAFRDAAVAVAVLEVGLGGRLDATNAVTPVLSVITSVDFDHQQYLGNTIEEIAREKAGIVKPGVPVVLGKNRDEVCEIVKRTADAVGAPLVYAPDGVTVDAAMTHGIVRLTMTTPAGPWPPLSLGLRGRHQIDNAITAARALELVDAVAGAERVRVPAAARHEALAHVVWPARLEMRAWERNASEVDVLIDGAHNPAGAAALAAYIDEAFGRKVPIVFAAMQDKDLDGMIRALAPAACAFVCTAAATPRAARPDDLRRRVTAIAPEIPATVAESAAAALDAAAALGNPVVVAGSLFLAGEIRELLS